MRPIDADALIKEIWIIRGSLQMLDNTQGADLIMHGLWMVEEKINEAPTIDADRPQGEQTMQIKEYKLPNGKTAVFEYDENGVGKITLECMDMLMGQLIAYKRCIQSRSFWDIKHCDGCMFYDDCPFNPRGDEDEP